VLLTPVLFPQSIAVGDEEFIQRVKEQTRYRRCLETTEEAEGIWVVREAVRTYGRREGQAKAGGRA
jgi:hypothetical protein